MEIKLTIKKKECHLFEKNNKQHCKKKHQKQYKKAKNIIFARTIFFYQVQQDVELFEPHPQPIITSKINSTKIMANALAAPLFTFIFFSS